MNIEIDIKNNNVLNTFNQNKLSESLHNYLMEELKHKPLKNITLTLIGDNNQNIENILHKYYEELYYYSQKIDHVDNYIRLTLFLIGIIAILIAEQFNNILNEIFLIAGWVTIWEVIYDILFNELKRKKEAKIYKALKNSQIIFKKP